MLVTSDQGASISENQIEPNAPDVLSRCDNGCSNLLTPYAGPDRFRDLAYLLGLASATSNQQLAASSQARAGEPELLPVCMVQEGCTAAAAAFLHKKAAAAVVPPCTTRC